MSTVENTALARRAIDEIVVRRNRAVIDELYAPDFDGHDFAAPRRRSPEGTNQFATMLRAALFHH